MYVVYPPIYIVLKVVVGNSTWTSMAAFSVASVCFGAGLLHTLMLRWPGNELLNFIVFTECIQKLFIFLSGLSHNSTSKLFREIRTHVCDQINFGTSYLTLALFQH